MLTIIVITKNEEKRIKACLESVKWADELIVVDNGSVDRTRDIAKKYTDKIFEYKKQDFAGLRNFALEKASGSWVLYIDADERVTRKLREEIKNTIYQTAHVAFALSRTNIIWGQEVHYGPYASDRMIRLLKKSSFKTWVGKVHEYATFDGTLGYTKNHLVHLTHRDIDQVVQKSLEWSNIDARLRLDAGHPPMTGWRFLRILVTETYHQGIKRRGFFNGTVGTIDALMQVFSMLLTYVRLWQLQQSKSPDEIYDQIDQKLITSDFK
jgi:glycosyltransferase involved in cell wall biosynthesis